MAKLGGCTENGSIRSVNGGCYNKETKSRQSSTPPVRNIFMPPPPKAKVSNIWVHKYILFKVITHISKFI